MELRKSTPLQSSPDRGKTLDLGIPAPTRFTLTGGQVPHLELLRRGNQSFYHRPPRRHFPMPPSTIRLRHDDPGREMYQPRRILRLDRSAKPVHRYNGPLDPDHYHCTSPNAPPTQDRRVYHPMSRWSVSNSPKSNCNSNSNPPRTYLTTPSNAQSNRHRSLAHSNPRPRIPLTHPKPRPNVLNRLLQLSSRSKRRRGNSLRPVPESHQQQVPPPTTWQLAREIHLWGRHRLRNRHGLAQTPIEYIQVCLTRAAIGFLHPRR